MRTQIAIPVNGAISGSILPPDTPVSQDAHGKVISRFGDFQWDWTPYTKKSSSVLNFLFWDSGDLSPKRLALLEEMHWLLYLVAKKRPGAPLAYQTLLHYLKTLRHVARHAESHRLAIRAILSSPEALIAVVRSTGDQHARQLSSLVKMLSHLGPDVVGYAVAGRSTLRDLRIIAARHVSGLKQFPPIPTRIYSIVLSALVDEVASFEAVFDRYAALVRECTSNPLVGRGLSRQWAVAQDCGVVRDGNQQTFPQILDKHGLTEYFSAKGFVLDTGGLSQGIYRAQTAARLSIQAFTGMRSEEVSSLPYDCLREESSNGRTHFIISGTTTKLNNGKPKAAQWVTSREGARAVRLAQRLADLIAGVWEAYHDKKRNDVHPPLFVSNVYLGLRGQPMRRKGSLHAAKFDLGNCEALRQRLAPTIKEEDLHELEQIDPHRAWRSEADFQIGKPWRLTSHQMRRSLALYAQRSGLVSLPSLRRQLQHLTEEMSRYYARGSAFARNFVGDDKKHFGYEWQELQPISAAYSYIINVLLSDDVLFGGHANWVDHRMRGADGAVVVNREITIRSFKRGELAYRETALGGCTNTDACDQIAIKWLDVDCVSGCRNLVGRLSKLDRVIAAQGKLVSALDISSVEFRIEKADLDTLTAARIRVCNHGEAAT